MLHCSNCALDAEMQHQDQPCRESAYTAPPVPRARPLAFGAENASYLCRLIGDGSKYRCRTL